MAQSVPHFSFFSGGTPTRGTSNRRAPRWAANALVAVLIALGVASIAYSAFGLSEHTLVLPGSHSYGMTTPANDSSARSGNEIISAPLPASRPVSITIPAIAAQSPLIQTGLNKDGTPAVPAGADIDKASWLTTSPTPGEIGPSVILGHVDTIQSGPSVFYNLHKLRPGQQIMVLRQDGTTATFGIKSVEVFDKDNFPNQRVYGRTNDAQLHLITCGGDWDTSRRDYMQNVVVFAELSSKD